MTADPDNLSAHVEALRQSGRYRVLEKFVPPDFYTKAELQNGRIGLVLDLETTGLHPQRDKIIELGLLKFSYDTSGRVHKILGSLSHFEDPGEKLSEEIRDITGLDDAMLAGKSIDDEAVAEFCSDVQLVIAHNADFDRKFIERRLPLFMEKAWACTQSQIDWSGEGIRGSKLEYLAYCFGFYFEGHRALIDCQATLHLLTQTLPRSGTPAMARLLTHARTSEVLLLAIDAPYEHKDDLKSRGYRWYDPSKGRVKAWGITRPQAGVDEELQYLSKNIYKNRPADIRRVPIDAFNRFSTRI